ncbi:VOC family protein [Pontibacter sp. KCTC 32443]|uniref:VOC family protein n=1 Tax=Pontibacter TaxID=323449 RepID=UPI00164E2E82|nr:MULTISPECIES: VOC family protein [Pontibacter]MBC5773255.1 VOC family protein [Pontibacter sp. KCTC 32443]
MSQEKNNVVGWFEIPVTDMPRAIKFYSTVFGFELESQQFGNEEMAWFPWSDNGMGASGSLVKNEDLYKPSADGTIVYFSSPSGDLANELAKVEAAGGKLLKEKTIITEEIGYMCLVLDTEGNRIAFHSRQ